MDRPSTVLVALLALAQVGVSRSADAAATEEPFVEVAADVGLDFVHFNGMSGRLYYPEVVGAGGALFDYDNDGDLDLYLVQGHMLGPDRTLADALLPPPPAPAPGDGEDLRFTDHLYRNDLMVHEDGSRELHFADVTEQSGLRAQRYGMGAAVGDIDNDGFVDLLVTNLDGVELWHNEGDGTFREVGRERGVADDRWSVSASFADFDQDGWLDLFIVDYIDFTFRVHKTCLTERGEQDYCLPAAYHPVPDLLLRNSGDGSFADVSLRAGLDTVFGNGLGVVAADFDRDGRLDAYVTNDLMPNQLWLNQGDLKFVDEGLLSGAALNRDGQSEASMGVAVGDADGDGDLDLFMTHFRRETNTFYRNDGGFFRDVTVESGLAAPSWDHTTFGTVFLDYDGDGVLDLYMANGAVTYPPGVDREVHPYPFDETNQLFRGLGGGRFADVSADSGPALALSEVSRGVLSGDLDNDGDVDLVVTNNNGPVRLLRNQIGASRPWLGARLVVPVGEGVVRDETGALLIVERRGAPPLVRRAGSDGSYASASDPRVLVGLGDATVEGVVVRWPGERGGPGEKDERFEVQPGRYQVLVKGSGKPAGSVGAKPTEEQR